MIWCDTAWVRVKLHGGELILSHVEAGDNSVSEDIDHVSAVKRGNRDDGSLQGKEHVPFHLDCEHFC